MKKIVEEDLNDLKAKILQDQQMLKAMPGNIDPEVMNKVLIPKIIREVYPDLDEAEVEEVRQHVVVDSVIKNGEIKEVGDKRFVLMAGKFVNINELHIDLIDSVNPFQKAFEILSKTRHQAGAEGDPGRDRHDADRHHRGRGEDALAEDQPVREGTRRPAPGHPLSRPAGAPNGRGAALHAARGP